MKLARALFLVITAATLPSAQAGDAARTPDVIFVPTPQPVVEAMLEVAQVGKGDVVYDLGCGDGRLAITAARKYGARAVCVDIDPQRVAESRENAREAKVTRRVKIVEGDLFEMDFRDATVVTLYLLPALNVRLRPILFEQLRPGSRVVSHDFDMGDWRPDQSLDLDGREVHYWVIPASVEGRWTVGGEGGSTRELKLTQRYQDVEGTFTVDGRPMAIENPRLVGDLLRFSVGGNHTLHFEGRVSGDRLVLRESGSGERLSGRRSEGSGPEG